MPSSGLKILIRTTVIGVLAALTQLGLARTATLGSQAAAFTDSASVPVGLSVVNPRAFMSNYLLIGPETGDNFAALANVHVPLNATGDVTTKGMNYIFDCTTRLS